MRKYLSLWESLSQVWLSEPLVVMCLFILKVYLFTQAVLAAISSLGEVTTSACSELNDLLDSVLNSLYYASIATQKTVEYAMGLAVDLAKDLISLCITVAKAMIKLLIELYLGTLACLCTAFVKGCLELVTDLISSITEHVQDAVNTVISAINKALSNLTLVINGFLKGLSALESLFLLDNADSISSAMSSINVTISSLSDITIPTTYIDVISNLSDSIPDFEDVLSNLTSIVTAPLDILDTQVQQLAIEEPYEFPIAENTTYNVLKQTCEQLEQVFEQSAATASRYSNYVIIGLALATLALLCLLVWLAWRKWKRHSTLVDSLVHEHLPVMTWNLLHEYRHTLLHQLVKHRDPRIQWLVYYTTTPTLARCAMIGITGVVGWALQTLILNGIDNQLAQLLESLLYDTTKVALTEMADSFANDTQQYISDTQESVNQNLLAPVTDLATDLYDTILVAESVVNNTVNSVFGDTIFAAPLQTIIYCTVGRKLETIEDGLAWLIRNSQLNLSPYTDLYVLAASESAVDSVDTVVSGFSDIMKSAGSLVDKYRDIIEIELIIALAFLGVWFLMFMVGCIFLGASQYTRPDITQQVISEPRPLDDREKRELGYPFRDPFVVTASSRYTDLLSN